MDDQLDEVLVNLSWDVQAMRSGVEAGSEAGTRRLAKDGKDGCEWGRERSLLGQGHSRRWYRGKGHPRKWHRGVGNKYWHPRKGGVDNQSGGNRG